MDDGNPEAVPPGLAQISALVVTHTDSGVGQQHLPQLARSRGPGQSRLAVVS
jgi:hypothetical protein